MKLNHYQLSAAVFTFALAFASCNKTELKQDTLKATLSEASLQDKMDENGTNPDEIFASKPQAGTSQDHLYLETNRRGKNSIFVFNQNNNGSLVLRDEIASGGNGSGEALGSQGALAVSETYNLLFAVNAGSNTISSFRINDNGNLKLLFTINSFGQLPNSLTVHKNLLYVLNNRSSNICGFSFTANGFLTKIEGSTHDLSGMNVDAPEIKFQPDGTAVYVTEKATNIIDRFNLNKNGKITSVQRVPSHGVTPFGFDFARNNQYLIVSNAANGFSGAGSCTSYKDNGPGGLVYVNGPVSNFQSAPCWVATTKYGAFAFVSNTGSNRISSYYIDKDGALTLINSVAAENGIAPIDIVVSVDNRFVYNINKGSHTLTGYKRMSGGVIKNTETVTSLPAFAVGLVSF